MFQAFNRPRRQVQIDLSSVRDTLLYIESDLKRSSDMTRLAAAIRSALTEIDRLEGSDLEIDKPEFTSARFLPARL